MQKLIYVILACSLITLSACAGKPKEKLAPCTWDHRGGCGKMVPLSHQDQL